MRHLTPLRYPGGKSRAATKILQLIPPDTKILYSPFFGGGSVELLAANHGITVHGSDTWDLLVNFWSCLFSDRRRLADTIQSHYFPMGHIRYKQLQSSIHTERNDYHRAAVFFALNRLSFSGLTFSGFSEKTGAYQQSSITKLANFDTRNLTISKQDFTKSIKNADDNFIYADPPYLLERSELYGLNGENHKHFDHQLLARTLRKKDNWILSYNNIPEIKALYPDYKYTYPKWSYGMSTTNISNEILIFSKGISESSKIMTDSALTSFM